MSRRRRCRPGDNCSRLRDQRLRGQTAGPAPSAGRARRPGRRATTPGPSGGLDHHDLDFVVFVFVLVVVSLVLVSVVVVFVVLVFIFGLIGLSAVIVEIDVVEFVVRVGIVLVKVDVQVLLVGGILFVRFVGIVGRVLGQPIRQRPTRPPRSRPPTPRWRP